MLISVPKEVLGHWPGLALCASRRHGRGLVNDTFIVNCGAAPVIVQRMNELYPGTVNVDIDAVTSHLSRRRFRVPRIVRTSDRRLWCVDDEGRSWRALTFVGGQVFASVGSPERAHAAGLYVAHIHAALAHLKWHYLHVVAPLQDPRPQARSLMSAMDEHRSHRLWSPVSRLADTALQACTHTLDFSHGPTINGHGDLKISNLIFDRGGEATGLLDFDTAGRIPWALELGDALRSWSNIGRDSSPRFDSAIFEAAVCGYQGGRLTVLQDGDMNLLFEGFACASISLTLRYLVDALREEYFAWEPSRFPGRGEHNLNRAANQWATFTSACGIRSELESRLRSMPPPR